MEIRALGPGDDRSTFESGDEALDRFFHLYAGQNQFRHYLGVTWVAVDGRRVLGFATVAPLHLDIEDLPARARKKLPRYPLPVLGLARLAVDKSARSMGLGSQLLRFVLLLAVRMSEELGCAGVVSTRSRARWTSTPGTGSSRSHRSRATLRRDRSLYRCGCRFKPSRRLAREGDEPAASGAVLKPGTGREGWPIRQRAG